MLQYQKDEITSIEIESPRHGIVHQRAKLTSGDA